MATVLYIDQDESTQSSMQAVLGQHFNLVSATDGPTAVQYCAMIQPDLILIDLNATTDSTAELVSRLKMFMPQTPILALADEALPAGSGPDIDDVLLKPISASTLLQRIHSLLPPPDQLPGIATLNQAYQRLAALNTVSALIGTSLDLEHLTDEILAQIHKTVDFDSATLFLLKGNVLEAAASRGFTTYRRGMYAYHETERNSAWRAAHHKLPLIIKDVTRSIFWEPRPGLDKIRSWLGVPLIYKNRVVGVLTLDKNEANAFSDADARYVFTLAYQIAIAVENAELFEEWEEQATRLKLINEVAQEINTFLDVDGLFDALAQAIFERLAYDCVTIFQIDETRSLLTLKALAGLHQPAVEVGQYQQDLQHGLIGQAITSGRPLLINDLSEQDNGRFIEGLAVRSVLIVPLAVGTQIEAVICVGRDVPNGFGDQDLWTLSSLGSQAAIGVKNAWLYRSLDAYSDTLERTIEARTQRLQAIRQISQLVSQGLSIDNLLKVVRQGIADIFTLAGATGVEVTIGLRNGAKVNLNRRLTIKIDPATLVGQVMTQGRSKLLSQVKRQNLYALPAGAAGETIESLLIAPLIAGGKVIGVIMVESQMPELFDESDLETLDTLAFQIASAIEHARLLQKTKEMAIVDERTRLARDMHDGIAQNLAYLLIQVDRALNMVEDGSKAAGQLEQISSLLKQNIDELRRHIFDLRPLDLEGKPIFEVLERFVTEFGQRWNLKTTCTIPSQPVEISPEVERAIYRILQEALSNARQHAQCKQLTVTLVVADQEWVNLEICDDGVGFEINQSNRKSGQRPGKGLGLTSMRERAQRVGGQLRVESGADRGTHIIAMLPLQEIITTINQAEGKYE